MRRTLVIRASDDLPRWFRLLERRGLIRTLAPTARVRRSKKGRGAAEAVYGADPRFGGHMLLCVKPDSPLPKLNWHPDNEEFILVDPRSPGRPLYLLFGLLPAEELARKAREGRLGTRDFVLLKMRFNDPRTSVFTMLKGTVHCEIVFPGRGRAPVFFVTEPRDLPMEAAQLPGYSISCVDGQP